MATAREGDRGLNRRDLFKAIPAFVPPLSSLAMSNNKVSLASEPVSGFDNLERAVSKIKRVTLRVDLQAQLGRMEAARNARDREALTLGFQRLLWFVTQLRHTLAPGVRRALLKNLLLDAGINGIDLPNEALAKREIKSLQPALG